MATVRKAIIACAVLAFTLGACTRSSTLDKLEPGAVVLAFGDSLTHGTGANPADAYPAVLERQIARKVVNAGVPGETSAEGLARLPGVLEEVRPRLLILCHGGNDFLRRLDESAARDNVRAMIALARERGVAVVLLATPKPGVPPSIPAFYGEIAADLRVPFEDAVMRAVLVDNRLKSDLVHPNAQGYAQIAGAVKKLLEKSGAL
jgi:lysophospholipase L1-like esterase